MEPLIINSRGEKLSTLVEGNLDSNQTIVFVHGFGTGKDESFGLFVDLANSLKDKFRIVRFDLAGCGRSEGRQEDQDYQTWSDDLDAVLKFSRANFPGSLNILAQSMGCFVALLLNPDEIQKTVFMGIPNTDSTFVKEGFIKRIKSRPGHKIDFKGTTLYVRAGGEKQKIGPTFWRVLADLKPLRAVAEYAGKTDLLIIHYFQDEILGTDFLKNYDKIGGVRSRWLKGDHSLTKPEDRKKVMTIVRDFFLGDSPDRG